MSKVVHCYFKVIPRTITITNHERHGIYVKSVNFLIHSHYYITIVTSNKIYYLSFCVFVCTKNIRIQITMIFSQATRIFSNFFHCHLAKEKRSLVNSTTGLSPYLSKYFKYFSIYVSKKCDCKLKAG